MNRPWMPLYIADYLADTAHLNAAQSGAYLHLIMHYWQTGSLPADDQALARIARMTAAEWKRGRQTISTFFLDGWRHKRIDAELAHAEQVSSKRRAAAEQRHSKGDAIASANAEQMDTHACTCPPASPSQPQSQDRTSSLRSEDARARRWPFEQFWKRFPNKVGRQDAQKAFVRVEKAAEVAFDELMAGLDRYVSKADDRPWCNPSTWLNQGRWTDQPATVPRRNGDGKRTIHDAANDLVERVRALGDPVLIGGGEPAGEATVRLLPPGRRE